MNAEIQAKQDEIAALLNGFPHPRNQPLEAVITLHKIRMLRDEIKECQENHPGQK
jgi:hypothetical protein